jgi:hypothetical protein
MTRIMDTLHEEIGKFMTGSCSVLLTLRSVSDKIVQVIKAYFMSKNIFPKIVPFIR